MKSIGSSVIGEGSYGCVHKPKLQCNNSKKVDKLENNKFISKFMLTKEAVQELSEYTTISRIDTKKHYYLGKPLKCKPKNNKYNLNSIKKCDIYKNINSKSNFSTGSKTKKKYHYDKFSLLIIPDGGIDISKLADSFSTMHVSEKNAILQKFWKNAPTLFHGIQTFEKHGIIHHDIKPQNVVFNTETGEMKFIDFGLMRKINEVIDNSEKNENFFAEDPFWTYPFELPYLNYESFEKVAELSIEEKREYYSYLVNKLKDPSSKISIACRVFFDYILRNYKEEERTKIIAKYFEDFMDFICNETDIENYETFLKKSIHSIDLYGVGITLQFMLCYSEDIFDSAKITLLKECFYNMMRPSVSHRYTIQEALEHFSEIMKTNKQSVVYTMTDFDKFPVSNIQKLNKKTRSKLVEKQEDVLEKIKSKSKIKGSKRAKNTRSN